MNRFIKNIFIAYISVFIVSCGDSESTQNEKLIDTDTAKQIVDTAQLSPGSNDMDSTSANKKSNVEAYWYFNGANPETGEQESSTRTKLLAGQDEWCYDSMSFEKLVFEGQAEGVLLTVKHGEKTIFQEGPFDVNGKKIFKANQFNLSESSTTIEVTQNGKSLFKTTVKGIACS